MVYIFRYSTKNTNLVDLFNFIIIKKNKYIVIIEVGSTSSDWYFIERNDLAVHIKTNGFNPTYSEAPSTDFINDEIKKLLNSTEFINYYGTGASTDTAKIRVKNFFNKIAPSSDLVVSTDMLSAVRACCGNAPGIVSILGTGSNTCYFDGTILHPILPSMGYIIGDQGSGSYIGKLILQDYFFNKMPLDVHNAFKSKYELTRASFLENLYTSSSQAQYLASYVPFLNDVNNSWKDELLEKVFREFINLHLLQKAKTKKLPLHFVGSIAYYFKDRLLKVLKTFDLDVGKIIREPGMDLVNYHKNINE